MLEISQLLLPVDDIDASLDFYELSGAGRPL